MLNAHRVRLPARPNLDSMRRCLVIVAAVSSLSCSIFPARSDEVTKLDVRPVCRGIANQSGQSLDLGLTEKFNQCVTSEQEVRGQLKTAWHTFSSADKRHCVSLIKMGGESSYTELLTCLEMARDVRALKSADSASSRDADVDKPSGPTGPTTSTQPPPKAAAQPATIKPSGPTSTTSTQPPPKAAAQPATIKSSPSISDLQKQVDQAKTDASIAKRSNDAAVRKAADAEAALRQKNDEVDRLKTEAEQFKADAQSASVAQASLERKIAELESPRALMERRTAERESADTRLRTILVALSFVIAALAITIFYLLRKMRAQKALPALAAPGVVPESNGVGAENERVRPGAIRPVQDSS